MPSAGIIRQTFTIVAYRHWQGMRTFTFVHKSHVNIGGIP
jgi:hypothetical protein